MFSSEKKLIDRFVDVLGSGDNPWGCLAVSCEFFYARGRTDVVASADGTEVIAFEAKLKDWRCALDQAYRNTCFAHKSYVIAPKDTALNAYACIAEFRRRGVGLCYMEGSELTILEESQSCDPIEPWTATQAMNQLCSDNSSGPR